MLKFAEFIKEYETNHYNDFVKYCENNNVEITETNFKNWLRNIGTGAAAASALTGNIHAQQPGPATQALHQAAGVEHQKKSNIVLHVTPQGTVTDAGGRPVNRNNLPPAFANKFGSLTKKLQEIIKNTPNIQEIHLLNNPASIHVIDIDGNGINYNF